MDMNAFNAIKTYGGAQSSIGLNKVGAQKNDDAQGDFKVMDVAKKMASSVVQSEQTAAAFMVGEADPHSVVEAIASAELAVETAVTLRNRVVEAYQELLRMPI